jgi:A/G-specific adenine glycosylase
VLVSEIMLQQTHADRVVAYYKAFFTAFPTLQDCARARPAEVVRLWSGLGYNRRALNLQSAARVIAEHYGGTVPADEVALRSLPGVGPYTARAVLALAFEAPVAPVDTNVIRVLARSVVGTGLSAAAAQRLADRLVPLDDAWAFTQSLFDLGATVCTGTRPACSSCPLQRQCRWWRSGLAEPDPWRATSSARPQPAFAGSDRQGRGRLLHALRQGPVASSVLAEACGWPDDQARSERIGAALVAEGFAQWRGGRLRLR